MKELREFIKNNREMSQELDKIKTGVLKDRKLRESLEQEGIAYSEEKMMASLIHLMRYQDEKDQCRGCGGLTACSQENKGFMPKLKDEGHYIHLYYTPCEYKRSEQLQLETKNHLRSFYMPKKILEASIHLLDLNNGNKSRIHAITKCVNFASSYDPNHYQKGVYLHGNFGVGKTYILAAMANELAKRRIHVGFVYLPDMIRELKGTFGSRENKLEVLMNEIKNIQVLILDDIGAEMNSQWVRDEILGPILQYRMLQELPTFFSSNKSIDELIRYYATTTDHIRDDVKAERIGDRIKTLTVEVEMSGKNYRY